MKNSELKLNIRTLNFLRSLSPRIIEITVLKSVFTLASPYLNLYMSAEIMNELAGYREIAKLKWLVAITIGLNFIFALLREIINRNYIKKREVLYLNQDYAFNVKTLNLDYEDLENSEISRLRQTITRSSMANGYGSMYLLTQVEVLINSVVELVFTMVMFTQLMAIIVKNDFSIINVLILIIILSFILLIVFYRFYIERKSKSKSFDFSQTVSYSQRINSAIDYDGIGKDVRLYSIKNSIMRLKHSIHDMSSLYFIENTNLDFKLRIPENALKQGIQVTAYLFIIKHTIDGIIGIGSVIKYIGVLNRFVNAIIDTFGTIANIKYNTQFLHNYMKYIDIPEKMHHSGTEKIHSEFGKYEYEFEFNNVSFIYPTGNVYVLRNISMKIKKGEKLAIVGVNGSGKSTFIKLLCRLYDPTEGNITLNGKDIKDYDYSEYMEIFSMVFQDFKLLSFSLGDNITAGKEYDMQKINRCLEEADISHRVSAMENGFNTYLYRDFDNSGIEISGGEAQKIAIARALYKNAPILILDEPTAALDPRAEYEIYSSLNEVAKDRTAIYISHRLSSCRFCDQVLVFDDGIVVQKGTHEDLVVQEDGKYYELWNAQAQYYK